MKERTDNVPRHIFHCMILIAISTGNSELSEHYHNYERFTNMLPIEKLVLITAIAAIGDTTSEAEIDGNLLDLLLGGLILKQLAKDLKGLK